MRNMYSVLLLYNKGDNKKKFLFVCIYFKKYDRFVK